MNIKEIFKDSLSYPTKDIDKLLTLGVLFFFDAILSLLPSITVALNQIIATQILYFISNIVGIIVMIMAGGYILSIIKNTIENKNSVENTTITENKNNIKKSNYNEIPSIKITKNFVDGIKIAIISILYSIIPILLTTIVAYINGTFNFIIRLAYSYMYFGPEIMTSNLLSFDTGNIVFTLIFMIVLFIITSLLLVIGISRLADTNSIKSALNLKEVILDISKIKVLNYIVYAIVFGLILAIILIISLVISVIPFIGLIILFLLIIPFITIFFGRTLGLIYKKSKINIK